MSVNKDAPIATVISGHTFTVDSRYILQESRILGKGSFGVVCTAYDSVRKIDLAIKRIRPYANDEWDAKHTLREIRLMKLLGPHPNIVSVHELSLFQPKTELYMMIELMDCDLHRVIQSKQALSEKHHKCFMKQLLEGVKAMHSVGCFHRDLKPGNILVSKDCQLRITDFGLARFMDDSTRAGENEVGEMTQYVVTRWYRPPELLLAPNLPYQEAVDLWSCGCILAELLRRKPLFPGKSHLNQAQLIFECLGFNNINELGFPVSVEASQFLDKKCRYKKQSFKKFIPDASDVAIDFLDTLLRVNPNERPSADAALKHLFLNDAEILHDYTKTYVYKPSPEFFEFEHTKFTVSELKRMIELEVEICAADSYKYPNHLTNSSTDNNNANIHSRTNTTTTSSPLLSNNQNQSEALTRETGPEFDGANSRLPTSRQNNTIPEVPLPPERNNLMPKTTALSDNPFRATPSIRSVSDKHITTKTSNNITQQTQNIGKTSKTFEDVGIAANTYRDFIMKQQPILQKQIQPYKDNEHQSSTIELNNDSTIMSVNSNTNIPIHTIPNGNILTAIRNEAPPSHIPPGSRTKTPKSPSPKKIDQIIQKDLINKRRFRIQQQAQIDSDNITISKTLYRQNNINQQTTQVETRPLRTLSASNNNQSKVYNINNNITNNNGMAMNKPHGKQPEVSDQTVASRFSRLTNFPTSSFMPARLPNMGISSISSRLTTNRRHSNPNVNTANTTTSSTSSEAMIHSGSNVINSEHQL